MSFTSFTGCFVDLGRTYFVACLFLRLVGQVCAYEYSQEISLINLVITHAQYFFIIFCKSLTLLNYVSWNDLYGTTNVMEYSHLRCLQSKPILCTFLSPKSLLRFLQTTTPYKKHAQCNQACINPSLHCKVLFYQTTPTNTVPLFAPI